MEMNMPIILKNYADINSVSGVWEITEPESSEPNCCDLSLYDKTLISNTKSQKRKLEIITVRKLVKSLGLNLNIKYSVTKKPIVENGYLGISHSKKLVTIIYNKTNKCSVDIEKVSDRLIKSGNKVFSKNEIEMADKNPEILTLFWCVKECIFKIIDKSGINFIEDIKIKKLDKTNRKIFCEFIAGESSDFYELDYLFIKKYALVWCQKK